MHEDNLMVTSENLITAALNGGGHDNITASLVLIEESTHESSRFVHFNPKPKLVDMTSTQQFGGGSTPSAPKKSKLAYFIGGGVILIGTCVGVMMMMGKEDVENRKSVCLKVEDLTSGKGCNSIKLEDSVDVKNDTLEVPCGDEIKIIFIENNRISKIDKKSLEDNDPYDSASKNEGVENEESKKTENNKKILDLMNESQIKKLKIGSAVEDKNGVQIIHKHKITVKDKKIEDIVVLHTVQSGQGLSGIVKLYKSRNKSLSELVVAKYNQQHGSLTEDQKSDIMIEEHKLTAGSIIEIPLKGKE
jgi:hypothetical protein